MGLGDSNYHEGGKKSRFDFELKTLQALQKIRDLLATSGGGSGQVKVSNADTTANYLNNKLTVTAGVLTKSITNSGANEELNLTISPLGVSTGLIANDAVTYAKIQNISATQRVLGRNTAGAGDTEEVTASQVLDWIGSTQGQILYRGSSAWVTLNPGTAGQVLQTNGGAANPSWANTLQYISLANNVTTTSNTAGNITGMNFSVAANAEYLVEFSCRNGCTTANGMRFALSVPAGTVTGVNLIAFAGSTAAQTQTGISVSGSSDIAQTVSTLNTSAASTLLKMKVKTGGNSGTFQLQFRSFTLGDTSTIFAETTYMSYVRIV